MLFSVVLNARLRRYALRLIKECAMTSPTPERWRLSEARDRLNELIKAALESAPQIIHTDHKNDVVVIPLSTYYSMMNTVKSVEKESNKHTISRKTKEHLLTSGKGPEHDPLDDFTDQ